MLVFLRLKEKENRSSTVVTGACTGMVIVWFGVLVFSGSKSGSAEHSDRM